MGNGTGLLAQYFDDLNFSNLLVSRTDATIDFAWGTGSPVLGIASDTFSVRWTGLIEPLYSETYTFHTMTDDGVRLWVNDQLIIDQWVLQGDTEHSGTITLEAGKKYNIRMEYFDNTKGATAKLLWSSPSQQKEIIPQSQLYSDVPGILSFSTPVFQIKEDGTSIAAVEIIRTGGKVGEVSATINLSDGTANTADYNNAPITVTFANGDDSPKTIIIPIVNDTLLEEDETINLTLTNATGGAEIDSQNTAVLTIVDDDFVQSKGTGLTGQYYDNSDFTNLKLFRIDDTVDFAWARRSPAEQISPDTFSVRWTGQVEPLSSEAYTFHTITDDGVRLWIDDQLIIDQWLLQGPTEWSGTINLLAGQKYDIKMEYFDNTKGATAQLLWSSPTVAKQIIPQAQLYPDIVEGQGTGLTGQYYDNSNFTNLKLLRTDAAVDFAWGSGTPSGQIDSDTFSVRWTGQIEPLSSEAYTFHTITDDGVRLWVNDQLIIDKWRLQGPTEWSGTINLLAGQKYDIKMEYFENTGGATAKLLWSSLTVAKEIIPKTQLYAQPILSINDAVATEGDVGTTNLTFTVSLSAPTDKTVTANFATLSNTATEGTDYVANSGTITFAPGTTQQTLTVQIHGDRDLEADENFFLNLTDLNNAFFADNQAVGTIRNDDFLGDFWWPEDVFGHHQIANVKDYGAKGDGLTDDTTAILQAMSENRTIYFPNGTYLVSDTLQWADDRRLLLQGESREHTVIKLKNNRFTNPINPKPVITTFEGGSTGQSFQNSIYNLTVDVGSGNPGAIGVRFLNNNQGGIRNVTIQSSDANELGHTGLALTNPWPGPASFKDVTIKGFDVGIRVNHPEYSNVFENVVLENQRIAGIVNDGNILTIRGLTSNNSVPVIRNEDGRGIVNLIDANLTGGSSSNSAIEMQTGTLYARNVTTSGYQSAIKNSNVVVPGSSLAEYVFHDIYSLFPSPQTSLNLPVEETPEILYDDLSNWASVTTFGAVADDGLDDSAAIQMALDSGKSTIYFPGGNYNISNTLQVGSSVNMITGATYQTILTIDEPLKSQVQPVFRFEGGNQNPVVLERFFGNYGGGEFHWIEQATSRTLVLRNFLTGSGEAYRNTVSGGRLFIEDVTATGWQFEGQKVWARQLNAEGIDTKVLNNGGDVWILGIKTENGGTIVETTAGGRTEVLGGLIYPGGGGNNIPPDQPAFINNESSLTVVGIGESRYGVGSYEILVRETRNGEMQELLNNSEMTQRGNGFLIPLYAGSSKVGDELIGDTTANMLVGDTDSNLLTGGGGADTFVYNSVTEGLDTITDFASDDLFQISASGFGGGLTPGVSLSTTVSESGVFVSSAAPTPIGSSANFLYNTSTGVLSFDLDGTGPGAVVAIVTLEGIPTIDVSQFTIVS